MIADCMAVGMLPVSYPPSQLPARDQDSFWRPLSEQARFELNVGDGPFTKAMRTLPVTVGECGTHLGLISKAAVVLLERNEEVTLVEGGCTLKAIKGHPDLVKFWAAEKLMRIEGTLLAQSTLMLDERGYDPNMKLKLWNFSVKCPIVTLEQKAKTISIDVGCISVEFVLDGGVSQSGIDTGIYEMDHHYVFGTGCGMETGMLLSLVGCTDDGQAVGNQPAAADGELAQHDSFIANSSAYRSPQGRVSLVASYRTVKCDDLGFSDESSDEIDADSAEKEKDEEPKAAMAAQVTAGLFSKTEIPKIRTLI
jgi:hypothetical protein